jgi:hypothetical protein
MLLQNSRAIWKRESPLLLFVVLVLALVLVMVAIRVYPLARTSSSAGSTCCIC